MAEIHQTTLTPTKLELLAAWVPLQRWCVAKGRVPRLRRLGGYRLDDPEGVVGIEVLIVSDESGPAPIVYQIPLTYRPAALAGAEHHLIGTTEHGVLGRRWVYDAPHDPVFVAQLIALVEGRAAAQHSSVSHVVEDSVVGSHVSGPDVVLTESAVLRGEQSNTSIICHVTDASGDPAEPIIIKVFRTLQAGDNPDVVVQSALTEAGSRQVPQTVGFVTGTWLAPDHPAKHARHDADIAATIKQAVDRRTRVVTDNQRARAAAAERHAAEVATVARQRAVELERRRERSRPTLHEALLGDIDKLAEKDRHPHVDKRGLPDPRLVPRPVVVEQELPRIPGREEFDDFVPEVVGGHLAFAQQFFPGVEDAWRVALRAAGAGTDFSREAYELGEATARIHTDLAATLETRSATDEARAPLLLSIRDRYASALSEVPALAAHDTAVRAIIERLERMPWPDLQRIHGDYHLGQVLHVSDRGWVAVDFEGEPLRSLSERVRPDLALRDVAGMLRSFDYAGGSVEMAHPGVSARAWVETCRAAFLDGYATVTGLDLVASAPIVRALELDKALYEVVYEARNRPTWLGIPTTAIDRIVSQS
ncbi:MAG: hypothetical protein ABI890_09780, partial [Lapillicoccus sp.]